MSRILQAKGKKERAKNCNEIHRTNVDDHDCIRTMPNIVCLLLSRLAMVRVECRSVLVQRWKLMVIKQQLQVTYSVASLGRSQAGNPTISGTIGKVKQRSSES